MWLVHRPSTSTVYSSRRSKDSAPPRLFASFRPIQTHFKSSNTKVAYFSIIKLVVVGWRLTVSKQKYKGFKNILNTVTLSPCLPTYSCENVIYQFVNNEKSYKDKSNQNQSKKNRIYVIAARILTICIQVIYKARNSKYRVKYSTTTKYIRSIEYQN